MPNPKVIWESFFEACDLPKKLRQEYAESFVSQRIQPNMLKELDKDMLRELGVTTLGDQLAIMRYIKETDGVNAPAFKQIQTPSSKETVTTSSQEMNSRHVQKAKATSTSRVPMASRSVVIKKPQTTPQSVQPKIGGLRSDEILQERAASYRLADSPAIYRQQAQPSSYSRIDRELIVPIHRTTSTFTQAVRQTQISQQGPVRRSYPGVNIRQRITRRPPTFQRDQFY